MNRKVNLKHRVKREKVVFEMNEDDEELEESSESNCKDGKECNRKKQ